MRAIRVLLVDDNPEFLDAAARFVSTEPLITVVGHALSGGEAIEQVGKLRPDLVLVDYVMPDMNGVEVTRHVKGESDGPRVVLLTLHDIPEYRTQAKAAGADGFLAKADFGRDLLPLISMLFNEAISSSGNALDYSHNNARESSLHDFAENEAKATGHAS